MKRPIKLLILAKSIDGGTGTFVTALQKLEKRMNNKLLIKTLVLEKPSYRNKKNNNFSFANESFYPEKYKLTLATIINIAREYQWFRKHVQTFNPDIVLSIDSHCLFLSEFHKTFSSKKKKTIATIHNNLEKVVSSKSPAHLCKLIKYLTGFFLARSDSVVCVSKTLSRNVQKSFNLKRLPKTIYNGLDTKTKSKVREINAKKPRIILSVARLSQQKDHSTLIKAFYLLQKKIPEVRLWLVGGGPLTKTLKLKVKKLGLEKKVKFFGWIKKVSNIYKKADIFVLPTKWEGFGYVLIEAMSYGLPVISSDVPFGPSEILDKGKYGILVPPTKSFKLKNAMLKLLKNPNLYQKYSKRSLGRSKYFTEDKMLLDYSKIITKF